MPVELSDLLSDERWVEVEYYGNVINVAYRPDATSLRRQAEIQKLARTQDDTDELEQVQRMGEIFCEIVCDWDLTSGGEPLPLTPDVVTRKLPGPIFNAIMGAIGEDGRGAQEEKKQLSATSDATLVQTGKRATSRNGIHSSAPQGTWASPRGK